MCLWILQPLTIQRWRATDYTAASGTLDFAEGEMSRSFDVTILDDSLYEGDEVFTVTLSNVQGGATLGTPASARSDSAGG